MPTASLDYKYIANLMEFAQIDNHDCFAESYAFAYHQLLIQKYI